MSFVINNVILWKNMEDILCDICGENKINMFNYKVDVIDKSYKEKKLDYPMCDYCVKNKGGLVKWKIFNSSIINIPLFENTLLQNKDCKSVSHNILKKKLDDLLDFLNYILKNLTNTSVIYIPVCI